MDLQSMRSGRLVSDLNEKNQEVDERQRSGPVDATLCSFEGR